MSTQISNEKIQDIMDSLRTSQIHELDSLTNLTGREQILIDNGEETRSITVDGLLGYFTSRYVGNDEYDIDITALNAASCIHIIKPDEEIPENQRIKGHFYLKLSAQNIDKLYEAIEEDHEGNKYYLETGKDRVSGLLFPDHYYINDSDYTFLKILTINIEEQDDNVYVSETFDLNLSNRVSDGYIYSKYNKVHFEFLYSKTTKDIVVDSIVLTATDLSNTGTNKEIARIICTRESQTVITLWLCIDNVNTVLINRNFSLSDDKAPENHSHIKSNYIATYVDNNKVINSDLSRLESTIGTKLAETVDANSAILKRITSIENTIIKTDLDIKFNSVTFNTVDSIDTNEQQMNATLIRRIDPAYTFLKINDDGTVSVTKDGYYAIGLKQGFKVVRGSADLTLNVYVNSSKIEDLTSNVSLSDKFNIQYLTGQVSLRLHTTDKIKVTSKWSDADIDIINETALQITKYLDKVEDLDFGTIDFENYPYVGIARVGSARLLLGIEEGGNGEIEVDTYLLPFVDIAAVDESQLVEMV